MHFLQALARLNNLNLVVFIVNGINNTWQDVRHLRSSARDFFNVPDESCINILNATLWDFQASSWPLYAFIGVFSLKYVLTGCLRMSLKAAFYMVVYIGGVCADFVAHDLYRSLQAVISTNTNIVVVGHSHGGMAVRKMLGYLTTPEKNALRSRLSILTLGCPQYIPRDERMQLACWQYVSKFDFVRPFNSRGTVIDSRERDNVDCLTAHSVSRYFTILTTDKNA